MRRFFLQNKVAAGVTAELLSMALAALLLLVVLLLMGIPLLSRLRWFAGAFVPGILVVRAYAKKQVFPMATKAAAVTFFICFIAFMLYLGTMHQLL